MDYTAASKPELIRIIYDQQDRISALETQVAELRSRINQQGPKGKEPALVWVKPNVKRKKRGERKKRVHGFGRKLDIPTKRVFHSFDVCPDCGGKLGKPAVSYTRQTIDIPETPVEVTEHVVIKRLCFSCKRRVAPKINLSGVVVGKQRVGIRLMSLISMLKEGCRQPLEIIQSSLTTMYDLHLSQGALVQLLQRVATIGKPSYEELRQRIRESSCVYADETGGRENGKNGYTWSFNTKDIQFVLYHKSRKQTVVEDVLGSEFEGVLVSDFYAAYNTYAGFHQRCWVHYLRAIHELKQKYKKHPPLNKWAKKIKGIYEEAKAYKGPDKTLPLGLQERERIEQQKGYEDELRRLCAPWVTKETPMSTLAARAISFLPEMFTFVRFANVPSDNNAAERILRHTVVSRKISGGTRSPRGSETKAILTSLFGTWRLQNKNPLKQCQLLLATCQ